MKFKIGDLAQIDASSVDGYQNIPSGVHRVGAVTKSPDRKEVVWLYDMVTDISTAWTAEYVEPVQFYIERDDRGGHLAYTVYNWSVDHYVTFDFNDEHGEPFKVTSNPLRAISPSDFVTDVVLCSQALSRHLYLDTTPSI